MNRFVPASALTAVALLTIAGGGAAAALGGASDTRTAITVDCALGEGSNDNQVILPGETLTVTLLNCSQWVVTNLDGLGVIDVPGEVSDVVSFSVPDATPSYVFTVDTDADIELTFDGQDIDIDVTVATPAANPSGSLLATSRVTMPIEIPDFAIGLDELGSDVLLGDNPDCLLEAGYHPYQTVPITISDTGEFTFRVIDVTPVDEDLQWGQPYFPSQDFFLAVYTTFDPADPEAGLVSCNDDRPLDDQSFVNGGVTYISDDQAPEFIASLAPGQYTLVLTTFRSTSSDEWADGEFSSWSGVSDTTWQPTAMTALFELWGPTGSLSLGQNDQQPELAETGVDGSSAAGIAGAALALAVAGIAMVAARPRASRTV